MTGEDLKSRVDWLDSERKKDKALINQFKNKIGTLEDEAKANQKTLQEISGKLAHLNVRTQPSQLEDAIARYRDETQRSLDAMEKRRLDLEDQNVRTRGVERDRLEKSMGEIFAKLSGMADLKEAFDQRKEEQSRQAVALQEMRKLLDSVKQHDDERGRVLSAAEEGRKQDLRRMADIQGENQAIRQKASENNARLDALESGSRRLDGKISDLLASELDRRNALTLWQEQQVCASVELERKWKEWERRLTVSVAQMDEFLSRLETYSETLRAMRQSLDQFRELGDRVDQRMREMAEVQRVQEDRLRQDWAAFLADDQKRWTAQGLIREDEWREHDRQFARTLEKLTRMDEMVEDFSELVRSAQEGDRARLEALANLMREWLARIPQSI